METTLHTTLKNYGRFLEGLPAEILKVMGEFPGGIYGQMTRTLHLELRSVMCIGAEENKAHCCDPYGLRVQELPLFLVCSRIVFLLLWIKSHRSKNIYAGADQK